MLEASRFCEYSVFMDDQAAEIEILRLFLSYSRTLSLSGTPQRKIVAAKWEIFFQKQLSELEMDPVTGNETSGQQSDAKTGP